MSKATRKIDKSISGQQGLFDTGLAEGSLDISLGFRQGLSRAITECKKDRYQIAAEISRLTMRDMTKEMLDKYTSSDQAYRFPAEALTAFCHVTGCVEPVNYLMVPLGMGVIGPTEMKFVKLSRLEEYKRTLETEIMQLRSQCGIK